MRWLAALLLAAALVSPIGPALAPGDGVVVVYTYMPYREPSGLVVQGPGGFLEAPVPWGLAVVLETPPAPGSVIVGLAFSEGSREGYAVVLTPWGYALIPGVERAASWGPLVALVKDGFLETFKATAGGLVSLGRVELSRVYRPGSTIVDLEVSGGTVCLAAMEPGAGWVAAYASAWDPGGSLAVYRAPWEGKGMTLSACNAYRTPGEGESLPGSGLALAGRYIETPKEEPLEVPGYAYKPLASTPGYIAFATHNATLEVYRITGAGLAFQASLEPPRPPGLTVALEGSAPGVAAVGVAGILNAQEGAPSIYLATAYYNLTSGDSGILSLNVSLDPLVGALNGTVLNAAVNHGYIVPLEGGIVSALTATLHARLESGPTTVPSSVHASIIVKATLEGRNASTAIALGSSVSSAAGNGVAAAVSMYPALGGGSSILVAGDLESWKRLLNASGDPPAFIPVAAAARPGGGWVVVYRADGPGIPRGSYALGEPAKATGVVYAETRLGPAPQASPAARAPPGLQPGGPVKAVLLAAGSLVVPQTPGCSGPALLLGERLGVAAGMPLFLGVQATLKGGLAEPLEPVDWTPSLLAVECPGLESSQPWIPAGVALQLNVDTAGAPYEVELILAPLPGGATAVVASWLSGSPPEGGTLTLSCQGWRAPVPLPAPGEAVAMVAPADCSKGYYIQAPRGVEVEVETEEARLDTLGPLRIAWAGGIPLPAGLSLKNQTQENTATARSEATPGAASQAGEEWVWHALAAAAAAAITSLACIAASHRGR